MCSHFNLLLKRLAIWVLGDFWDLGGVFLGFSGNWALGGYFGGCLCVATSNLLLMRLAFQGFRAGFGFIWASLL